MIIVKQNRLSGRRGFSLLELMVALSILGIVVGIAMRATSQLIRTNANVSNNVDLVQAGRQFMDQISSDIHQSGYPSYKMFDHTPVVPGGPDPIPVTSYAGTYNAVTPTASNPSGLISVTSNFLQFEGDIDNSGTVSDVYLQLVIPAGGCPCTMRRGTIPKSASPGTPPYYTELTGVMNTDVFTYYTYAGSLVDPTVDNNFNNIRTVKIKLQVQSQHKDVPSGSFSVASLETEARINN
jgi:prepilin-type N-terminal cleavage/methylation domain-containing protein